MYDWLTAKPRHRGLTSRFLLTTFTSKLKPPAPYRKDVEHELICVGVLVSVCLATKAGSAFKHAAKPRKEVNTEDLTSGRVAHAKRGVP